MNIFIRELRAGLKSLLIWAGCVALLIAGIMGKYSGLSENDRQINELVAKMPKAVQVFVGGGAFDFTDISGYVGVTLGYIMLIASLFAVILGSNTVSREERDKTAEFLMTKPVKRWRVIVIKLTASFVFCWRSPPSPLRLQQALHRQWSPNRDLQEKSRLCLPPCLWWNGCLWGLAP